MAEKNIKTGIAVLAGGAGRRMGGCNKADLPAVGSTSAAAGSSAASVTEEKAPGSMLGRLSRVLKKMDMPCYLSVAAFEQPLPAGWTAVPDLYHAADGGFTGPLGGICSCLVQAKEDGLDGLFFVPCDAPLYEADVIEKMLPYIGLAAERAAEEPPAAEQMAKGRPAAEQVAANAVVWQTADRRLQTACGYYAVSCIPAMEEQLGNGRYRVRDCLSGLQARVIPAADADLPEERFLNINTPEDLARLRQGL